MGTGGVDGLIIGVITVVAPLLGVITIAAHLLGVITVAAHLLGVITVVAHLLGVITVAAYLLEVITVAAHLLGDYFGDSSFVWRYYCCRVSVKHTLLDNDSIYRLSFGGLLGDMLIASFVI